MKEFLKVFNVLLFLSGTAYSQQDQTTIIRGNTRPILSGGTTGTQGSVVFISTGGVFGQANSQLFYDEVNARVGIGTSAPSQQFHIVGPASGSRPFVVLSGFDGSGASGNLNAEIAIMRQAYSATNTSMLDLLAFSTATTNPAFRIVNHYEGTGNQGDIRIGYLTSSVYTDVVTITTNSRVGFNLTTPIGAVDVANVSGDSVTVRVSSGSTALFMVTAGGNVGIGVTNPGVLLDVVGGLIRDTWSQNATTNLSSVNSNSGVAGAASLQASNGTNSLNVYMIGTGYTTANQYIQGTGVLETSASDLGLSAAGANKIHFWTNSTERITILSGGNVGIGTTAPSAFLHINNGSGSPLLRLSGTANAFLATDTTQLTIQTENGGGQIVFKSANTVEAARITSTGNVGIGSTGPGQLLDVAGGAIRTAGTGSGIIVSSGSVAGNIVSGWFSGSATFNPGTIAANTCTDSAAITVTGAASGLYCAVGESTNAAVAGVSQTCYVSSVNAVKVRACCDTVGACVTTSQTYKVSVWIQ